MKEDFKRAPRSLVVIARLLGAEGFTDHVANEVDRYRRQRSGLSSRQAKRRDSIEKEAGEILAKMGEGERMVVGRFIGLHKKLAFDTGLECGLASGLHRPSPEPEDVERFLAGRWTGTSVARAISAYHALVTSQPMPPAAAPAAYPEEEVQ